MTIKVENLTQSSRGYFVKGYGIILERESLLVALENYHEIIGYMDQVSYEATPAAEPKT